MKKVVLNIALISAIQLMSNDANLTINSLPKTMLNDDVLVIDSNVSEALDINNKQDNIETLPLISQELLDLYNNNDENYSVKVSIGIIVDLFDYIDDDDSIGFTVTVDNNISNIVYTNTDETNATKISQIINERKAFRRGNREAIYQYVRDSLKDITGQKFVGDVTMVATLTLKQLKDAIASGYIDYSYKYSEPIINKLDNGDCTNNSATLKQIKDVLHLGETINHNGKSLQFGVDRPGWGGKGVDVTIVEAGAFTTGMTLYDKNPYYDEKYNDYIANTSSETEKNKFKAIKHWLLEHDAVIPTNAVDTNTNAISAVGYNTNRSGSSGATRNDLRYESDHAAVVLESFRISSPEANVNYGVVDNVRWDDNYKATHTISSYHQSLWLTSMLPVNRGAFSTIINRSYEVGAYNAGSDSKTAYNYKLSAIARTLDKLSVSNHQLNVVGAGNGINSSGYICNMGLSRNAVTVGSTSSRISSNNRFVMDNEWSSSALTGTNDNDFHKPEIAAPGDIYSPISGNCSSGTSYATPIVSGHIASLVSSYKYKDAIKDKPEALKLLLLLNSKTNGLNKPNSTVADTYSKTRTIDPRMSNIAITHSGYGKRNGSSAGLGVWTNWSYWRKGDVYRVGSVYQYDPDHPKHYNLQVVRWDYGLKTGVLAKRLLAWTGKYNKYGRDNNYRIDEFKVQKSGWYYVSTKAYKDNQHNTVGAPGAAVGYSYVWHDYNY